MNLPIPDNVWDLVLAFLVLSVFIGIGLDIYRVLLIKQEMQRLETAQFNLPLQMQNIGALRMLCDGKYPVGYAANKQIAAKRARDYLEGINMNSGHLAHVDVFDPSDVLVMRITSHCEAEDGFEFYTKRKDFL